MNQWIAFWNILLKDMRTYYMKPPNISWGLLFPLAWTGMFFIRSGSGLESIPELLPGVVALSILFGSTSVLAVTVTFEKKNRRDGRASARGFPLGFLTGIRPRRDSNPCCCRERAGSGPRRQGRKALRAERDSNPRH